ncbi:MAG: hypothetical protein ACOCNC_07840 [Acetivibrio ethanolgignens]
MKIYSFIKRLNATELGLGVTNDTYIAIPSEVNLSDMLKNRQALEIFDRKTGTVFTPDNSHIMYVQTGQNNQERISGLGRYYEMVDAKVGDEILIERIEDKSGIKYAMDFYHRNAIVFQKNRDYVEILTPEIIQPYAKDDDYSLEVVIDGKTETLLVKFVEKRKKKKTSPRETVFYDLQIKGQSILGNYSYQEYIEVTDDERRLGRMKTYYYSLIEMMEGEENE